jgi:hypothetical protein
MIYMMKSYKTIILSTISILITIGILFIHVPQGYAQEDQDWSQPVNLSLSGLATNPLLFVDNNSTLHALWIDSLDGYKHSQSDDDGVTWSSPQTVAFPFDKDSPLPTMLADSKGVIHIFWINSASELYYGLTTPLDFTNPSNWQVTSLISQDVLTYDVLLDSRDSLHITYIRMKSSVTNPAGVYYRQSNIGGGSWNNAIALYNSEYFRSISKSEAFVRIAVSNASPEQNIYVTWDSLPQKRVYMAVSKDSGLNWNEAQPVKSAEDTGGIDYPFHLNVAAVNNKVLIMWQEGQPSSAKCTVLSQWSEDGGENWGDVVSVLGSAPNCPISSKFIVQNDNYIIAELEGQVNPSFVAWNGAEWSDPQSQMQLPSFSNPVTYDAIFLGCRYDIYYDNRLYVTGCDQGGGEDVWFLSRLVEPLENWFSPSKAWGIPTLISGKSEKISSLSSVSDTKGVVHTVWAQSSLSDDGSLNLTMEYSRSDGEQITKPEPVITSLQSLPLQVVLSIDVQERLLLAWVDGSSGDLLFSWSNSERASLASEWSKPTVLPSPSKLNSAIDVLADGSGRIIVVYTVSVNEDRGLYIVQSTDNGDSWVGPTRIFDAVSAGWEKIENPKLSLGANGALHLIFSRDSVRNGQPVGLYYFTSMDGGVTWSDLQLISEGDILWSEVVCYDDQTVHVLWQEYDGLVYANLSQISQDSGVSWSRTYSVTGVNDNSTPVALATDGAGNLHYIQLVKDNSAIAVNQENLVLQDWKWTDSNWKVVSRSNLVVQGKDTNYYLSADITQTGFLNVSVLTGYSNFDKVEQYEVLSFKRFLEETNISKGPETSLIPTPVISSDTTEVPVTQPTQSVDLSELDDNNVVDPSNLRNIAGIIIIVVVAIITTVLIFRKRNLITKK